MKFVFTHMTGSKAGQTEELQAELVTVGRGDGNQVRYDPHQDDKVSAYHARLEVRGGQVFLTDLDSTNGTFLNGQRIQGSVPLVSGGVVTFGEDGGPNVAIQYLAGAGPAPAASPQSGRAPGLAKTEEVAVPPSGGPPPAAPAKPKQAGAGKKLLGAGILGSLGVMLLSCLLFVVLLGVSKQVRGALPPWATRILRRVPVVNKVLRPPRAPRLPGGIRAPRRLPGGSSGGGAKPAPSDDEQGTDEDAGQGDPSGDEGADEAPPDEGGD